MLNTERLVDSLAEVLASSSVVWCVMCAVCVGWLVAPSPLLLS